MSVLGRPHRVLLGFSLVLLAERCGSATSFLWVPSGLVPFMLLKLLARFAKTGLKHRAPGEEDSSVAVVCWSQFVTAHKSQLVNLQEFCKPVVKPLVA